VIGLTQTALAQNLSNPALPSATPYPSYTPLTSLSTYTPYPTYTFLPTYTLLPTYTPYPPPGETTVFQPIAPPSLTPEPNLIFLDTFDNAIDPSYWQQFGTWAISNGYPLLVQEQKYKSGDSSVFNGHGGLLFLGTSQMDNIAMEFDTGADVSIDILLSYQNEHNYKKVSIYCSYYGNSTFNSFTFVSNDNAITIPQSSVTFDGEYPVNHIRIEIRGSSLSVYVNSDLKYDFRDLPEKVNGTFGIVTQDKKLVFDNFKIYKLP
jgi:hypothetical protein